MSEAKASLKIHQLGIPLLISELWLRSKGCGQIDLGRLYLGRIELYEVKSSLRLSRAQWKRLQQSRELIALVLDRECLMALYVWQKAERFNWIPLL